MCDRYVLPPQAAAELEFQPAQAWWRFNPKFNVSPSQYVPAVRLYGGQSEGVMMRWGLIPSWAEGQPIGSPTAETGVRELERSDVFKMPWLSGQRCILPVAGFFTWRLTAGRYRQPYYVRLSDRSAFGVAAVWDRSVVEEDDDVIESCSIIAVPPNELMQAVAQPGSPMPAILRREDYATWLGGTPVQAKAALQTFDVDQMQAHAVSPRVNSRSVDDAGLIEPVFSAA